MKTIPFWKMSGSGNDFVVIDNRRHVLRGPVGPWAKKLCHRQFGVGADGLLLLERGAKEDFRMVYYNTDGSRADMCGNGARCMAWFAHAKGVVGRTFRFQTDAYPVSAEVTRDMVRITMNGARDYRPLIDLTRSPHPHPLPLKRGEGDLNRSPSPPAGGRGTKGEEVAFIDTGVPHAVVFVKDVERMDVEKEGRLLRFHSAFGPRGTNVNFVQKLGPHTLRVRTYERGVEGETLACGTGVAASAIAAALRGIVKVPVRCVVAGGDTLEVNFTETGNFERPATGISLKGPVKVTFRGEIII
jgi:diaminopimelate epimerase